MSFRYEILFQADVLHSYFDSGAAKDIWFEPTLECAKLLRDYHLGFRNTGNGFVVFTEQVTSDGINWVQRLPIDVGEDFNFVMHSSRADFLNITDSDLKAFSGSKIFFTGNNAGTPTSSPGPSKLSFDILSGALATALSLAPTNLIAVVDRQNNPVWLVLQDGSGTTISKTLIKRNTLGQITEDNVRLSDQPLPEGVYTLQQTDAAGAVLSSKSFFATDSSAAASAIGIFQIQYNNAVDAAVTANQEIHFTAKLAARKITWVYRIQVDKYDLPAEIPNNYNPAMLCLNAVNNVVPVLGQFNPSVIAGPPAVVTFVSNTAIGLKESPYTGVSLNDKTNAPALSTIINNLPNPNPQWLADAGGGNYKAEVSLKIK